jgi:hypothetical protein
VVFDGISAGILAIQNQNTIKESNMPLTDIEIRKA